jgi:hypothetical protein
MPAPDYATEISALESALSAGELTIEQDGERVTYQSASDLVKRLSYFQQKAAQASVAASGRGQFGFSAPAYSRD